MLPRRLLLAAPALLPTLALAQPRAVTLVVPFAPGGSTDIAARILAERMAEGLGARVVVENRSGAGGAVGSEYVKRAAPDGGVLLFASASSHGANPAVFRDLPYDAVKDFAAVALTGISPVALMVPPRGAADVAALRAALADGRGAYGSVGAGSITHLAGALFLARTGLAAEHVPYRGGGAVVEAVGKAEIPFAFEAVATLAGPARDGRVRALALGAAARSPAWAELPTLEELGVTPFDIGTWNAVLAPAGTPAARVAALAAAVQGALADPAVQQRLAVLGVEVPAPTGPEATARFIAAEVAKFRAIAEAANLRLERP